MPPDSNEVQPAVLVLLVEIGRVLEAIGIEIAVIGRGVDQRAIGKFHDLDVEALGLGDRHQRFGDLGVRTSGYAELDGLGQGGRLAGDEKSERGNCTGNETLHDAWEVCSFSGVSGRRFRVGNDLAGIENAKRIKCRLEASHQGDGLGTMFGFKIFALAQPDAVLTTGSATCGNGALDNATGDVCHLIGFFRQVFENAMEVSIADMADDVSHQTGAIDIRAGFENDIGQRGNGHADIAWPGCRARSLAACPGQNIPTGIPKPHGFLHRGSAIAMACRRARKRWRQWLLTGRRFRFPSRGIRRRASARREAARCRDG